MLYDVSTITQTLNNLKSTTTYQILEAFVTSIASNLLLPDPAKMLLDLARPEVFTAFASDIVRTHVYDSMFSGQIDPLAATDISNKIQNNPFDAQRAILTAASQTITEWLEPKVSKPSIRPTGRSGRAKRGNIRHIPRNGPLASTQDLGPKGYFKGIFRLTFQDTI